MKSCKLVLPNKSHEKAYKEMTARWESMGEDIQPELLGHYNMTYDRWLECCEDDRTTGSMLSTHVPCSLHFLVADDGEILGGMAINHSDTKRGHLHSGIAPWNRKQGYGSHMLKLALEICKNMGMDFVHIAPYKNNLGAIKTILNCGGILEREFFENEKWTQIYRINL